MEMAYFSPADFLLPINCDWQKWAVIACDQYTSQADYWQGVEDFVGNAPSTFHTFIPEARLNTVLPSQYNDYCANMCKYLADETLKAYPNSFIYVERTLQNGMIRQGIVGVIDLEFYDYDPKPNTKIFATEETVLQRVPPRVALRKDAALEFSHTVIFCDDPSCSLIESVGKKRADLKKLYDFDLMGNGGHICGYLLDGDNAAVLSNTIYDYEQKSAYLVGDGNHSLVTAKLTYEALKSTNPSMDWRAHPARFAMVELENIHSPAMLFEPIYRIVVCEAPEQLISDFIMRNDSNGIPVTWVHGDQTGIVQIPVACGKLPGEALQEFLDDWAFTNGGEIDYIHGSDTVFDLAQKSDTVGFLVPNFDKSLLFPYILSGKIMPRKTFSIGHAQEKRYYLEGRMIR